VKVKYLREAQPSLAWWHHYYQQTFPAGKQSAYTHLKKTVAALKHNPYLGKPADVGALRKLQVAGTPFALLYLVKGQTIEIVQLRDGRAEPASGFHEEQAKIIS
jgi:hypothetical protein